MAGMRAWLPLAFQQPSRHCTGPTTQQASQSPSYVETPHHDAAAATAAAAAAATTEGMGRSPIKTKLETSRNEPNKKKQKKRADPTPGANQPTVHG